MSHCALAVSRGPRYKYVQFAADAALFPPLLFDLSADAGQTHNLLAEGGAGRDRRRLGGHPGAAAVADADGGADAERHLPRIPTEASSSPATPGGERRLCPGRVATESHGRVPPTRRCGMLTPARHEEAAPVPDMQGKTVVVTGGNSGIGFETAAALAAMGARVLVTARNADKGRAAVAAIAQRLGGDGQVQLVVVRSGRPVVRAAGGRRDPRAGAEARRARQQRGAGADRAGRDGRRASRRRSPRTTSVPSSSRTCCSTGSRASAPSRIVNVASNAHGSARERDPLRRPPVREALPTDARLRAVEAGQHALHPGAGTAARGQRGDRQLAPSRHRADGLRGGRRHQGPARVRDQDQQSVLPLSGQGGPHLGLPGFLPRGGRRERGVLRQVQTETDPSRGRWTPMRHADCGR